MRASVLFMMACACAPPYSQAPEPARTRAVVQLAAVDRGTCALLSDGSVRCWGSFSTDEAQLAPTELAGFSRAVAIAAQGDRVCAIDDEREVWCGTLSSRARAVGIRDATELALTENTLCARLRNGDVRCEGKIVARGALQLVASRGRYAARLDDGRVLDWDADWSVEELQVDSVTQLFVTRHTLCARLWDGSSWCSGIFGDDVPAQLTGDFAGSAGDCAWSADGTVNCGFSGDLGIGALRSVVQVVAGEAHHCALSADGDVWCWGANDAGQLGEQVSATPLPFDVALAGRAWSISVSSDVSCALGSRDVFCWGAQYNMFAPRAPLRRAAAVAGEALAFNGSLVCGYSSDGVQCDGGDGFRLVRHDGSPLRITGEVLFAGGLAVAVVNDGRAIWWRASTAPSKLRAAALVHDVSDIVELGYQERSWLALRKDGTLLAQSCGDQICAPSSALALCPILGGVDDLAARGSNACVIRDGDVACWGSAFPGPAPSCLENNEPSRVLGVAGATRVAVGAKHACALVAGGSVVCWGDNDWGQLGNGEFVTRPQATRVSGLRDAVELALGDRHSCARLANGEVRCWGDIRFGQMGDGVRRTRSAPLRIRGLQQDSRPKPSRNEKRLSLTHGSADP